MKCYTVLAAVVAAAWRHVPEGEVIDAGLDIRFDFENGGTWVKEAEEEAAETEQEHTQDLALPNLPPLDTLEEKAHGYDDGAEIVASFGEQLIEKFLDGSAQAGRILSGSLRNNREAAANLPSDAPEQLRKHVWEDSQAFNILSALISTQQGLHLTRPVLKEIVKEVPSKDLNKSQASRIESLITNLAVSGESSWLCDWAGAIAAASVNSPTTKAELMALTRKIISHEGEFVAAPDCQMHAEL